MSPIMTTFSRLRVAPPSILLTSLSLAISVATAQKTTDDKSSSSYVTTTIWAPEDYGAGPGAYNTYASVIAADATATTYQLDCVPGRLGRDDSSSAIPIGFFTGCSSWPSVTLTVGASTAQIVASNGGDFHMTRGMACKVDAPASQAQCDFFLDGRGAAAMAKTGRWPMDPITAASEFAFHSRAVTITAGADKIRAAVDGKKSASPTTTSGVGGGGGGGEDPTVTITSSPAQGRATGTGTRAAGGSTSTSTSGADHSRRNRVVLGTVMVGVAAILFGTGLS